MTETSSDIAFLLAGFRKHGNAASLACGDISTGYADLADQVESDIVWLKQEPQSVAIGVPVVLLGDFSPRAVSLFLALAATGAICIPLTETTFSSLGDGLDDVAPQLILDVRASTQFDDPVVVERRPAKPGNDLYAKLIARSTCGLVLFTSGSTGKPKAVVHDFSALLKKFRNPRPGMVTLNFLLFDHWGGLNTLLGCLSSGALVVFPTSRAPHEIAALIERHHIALLPATPTFLNMLILSRAFEGADLSSLKLITYGAEPMPASTLQQLCSIFPNVELRQTYGMIELGVMRAKSRGSDSLWVKLGGEGYDLRVVDGLLQIKAESAMLGYLNAPSPFTDDGYFMTGDMVEQDGDYLRILGRASDLINVGGQKVYPAEVETVLLEMPEIFDAVVYGEKHVLAGRIVCADIVTVKGVDRSDMRQRVKLHCGQKLQPYMIPMRINFVESGLYTTRLKKRRDHA